MTDPNDISVRLESLPSPPVVAMEIIRLTRDEDSSPSDLTAVLARDPVLATRILQVANSPAYGLSREVATVDRATALLGLKAVKMMALSFSLASDVDNDAGALPVAMYWYHSLLNAVTARRWAELCAPGLSEEAFLAGLLSHLGRLALAREKAKDFATVLAGSARSWPSHAAEREQFGFSSAELTATILEAWGLPAIIVEANRAMYSDHVPDPEVNGAGELAKVMNNVRLTEAVLSGDATAEDLEGLKAAAGEIGVSEDEGVDGFVADLEDRVRQMAEMLDVSIPGDMSHQRLLDEARSRLVEVTLQTMQNLDTVEQHAQELQTSKDKLEGMVYEDRLTGIPNRAAFDDHLHRTVSDATRNDGETVGVLMMDIDHFKSFNDTYGHQVGDAVLREVARALSRVTRSSEMLARYGGEEFAMVAHRCNITDMVRAGERLREAVEELTVPTVDHGELSVTVSVGAAVADAHDKDAGQRITKLADEALYKAKETGRNRVCAAL